MRIFNNCCCFPFFKKRQVTNEPTKKEKEVTFAAIEALAPISNTEPQTKENIDTNILTPQRNKSLYPSRLKERTTSRGSDVGFIFEEMLKTQEMKKEFRNFLLTENAQENLEFLDQAADFASFCLTNPNEGEIRTKLIQLNAQFAFLQDCNEGQNESTTPINLSFALKVENFEAFNKTQVDWVHFLDKSVIEVKTLLKTETFRKFLNSFYSRIS